MLLQCPSGSRLATEAAGGLLVEAFIVEVLGEVASGDGTAAACRLVGAVHCREGQDGSLAAFMGALQAIMTYPWGSRLQAGVAMGSSMLSLKLCKPSVLL